MGLFLVVILLAEIVLLLWAERRIWGTWYTPFSFLSVPYACVVLFTIAVAGHAGLVSFYYPSLIPWIIGLPLFFIPSLLCFFLKMSVPEKRTDRFGESIQTGFQRCDIWKLVLTALIGLVLIGRLVWLGKHSAFPVGSERFGLEFAARGWAAHLMVIGMSLILVWTFRSVPVSLRGRKNYRDLWTWGAFILLLLLLFVYQVKSWIMLPVLGGVMAKVLVGKMKLRFLPVLSIVFGGAAVFFISYLLIYFYGNNLFPDVTTLGGQIKSISGLFVHYITSGTLGLSMDMQNGILENPDLQYVLTPIYNIWYFLSGQPLASGYNPEFFHTGLNYTNVRTVFGTLYVFSGPLGFLLCTLGGSSVCYFLFVRYRRCRTFCSLAIYAWICVVLFFGWFDSYIQLSTTFEIPFWLILFCFFDKILSERKFKFARSK